MGRKKQFKTLQDIIDLSSTQFMSMDICQLCGGYDTIQTYFIFKDNTRDVTFHICEKCLAEYVNEVDIIKAYINKFKKVVG